MDLYNELNLTLVRSEPNVWISRLAIYEKLGREPLVIRDIQLSRGLNIVWAEEKEEDDPAAEISGHSAGKTTFCRLIRYLLGERAFGNRANMDLIRKSIPEGYVAAEIHVMGKRWAVRRPFGAGRMSYMQENGTIDELLEQHTGAVTQDDYPKKLGLERLLESLETATVVRTDETIQWGHVLAWCSRDQESRFQSIYDWRSSRSQSDAPGFQRPKEGALFLMRAVLGLFLPDELKGEEKLAALQRKEERLERQIEEKRREPEYWVSRYDQELRRRLADLLPDEQDIGTLPLHSNDLFADLSRLTERAASDIKGAIQKHETEISDLQKQIDELGGQIRQHESDLQELDSLFNLNTAASRERDEGLSDRHEQRQQLAEHQNKMCPFGGVLIRDCSYVIDRQNTLRITQLQDAHAMEQAEASRNEETQRIERAKAEIRETIESFQHERGGHQAKRDSLVSELREKRQELSELRRCRVQLETWTQRRDQGVGYEALSSLRGTLEGVVAEMEQLESELTDLLRQHDANRDLLAAIFSKAVRAVLTSGSYDGEVSLANRELAFRITHGPAMSGEAVETLSVLLSDLAALAYTTVCDKAHLPGFILHDSPREADLGARIYRSFIRFVAVLQGHFGSPDTCPFQYILTTTTPPPRELQSDDVVKLRLNAGRVSEMLLRRNVAEPPTDPQQTFFDEPPGTEG